MEKEKLNSLIISLKEILIGAYFGYSMIYSFELKELNSFRVGFLLDGCGSPFTCHLKKKGVDVNLQMVEVVISRIASLKEVSIFLTNAKTKSGLPIVIPVSKDLAKIIYRTQKTFVINDIRGYMTNAIINNLNK